MNTCRFKHAIFLLVLSGLAGCGADPLGALIGSGNAVENTALPQAAMSFGDVTLVPPPGFCIDQRNLSEDFAMMARCDVLGAPEEVGDVPLGMIAFSLYRTESDTALPDPATTAAAYGLDEIKDEVTQPNSVIFRATGRAPIQQMDAQHWRGNALISGHIIALALYGPRGGRAVSEEGRQLLSTVIQQIKVRE
ncbi:MAG: hypothetical protein AAF755_14230 [Pseudomonadota bacterium]